MHEETSIDRSLDVLAWKPRQLGANPLISRLNARYVSFLGCTAALGGLLFGFDIAIISGAGPFLTQRLAMTVPVRLQWVANRVVVLVFPYAFDQIGKAVTFGFLTVMALSPAIFTWKFVPETRNKALKEIEEFWTQEA